MGAYQHVVHVRCPIERVFAFLMDAGNNAVWQPGVVHAEQTTPGTAELGTRITELRELMGHRFSTAYEVVQLEPPRRCEIASSGGPFGYRASYQLTEAGPMTKVILAGELGRLLLPGLRAPLVGMLIRRELAASGERLRRCLETQVARVG